MAIVKVESSLLVEVIRALDTVGLDYTNHASDRLNELLKDADKVTFLSPRVHDNELMGLFNDLLRVFGYGRRFYAADAVEEKCASKYVYRNEGGQGLRMGMLLGDLKRCGKVESRSAGKGRFWWTLVDPAEKA